MREEHAYLAALKPDISPSRAEVLKPLIAYILERQLSNEVCRLTFICTHNARRSHMAQLWAAAASTFSNLDGMEFYSGGVEVTRFHPNAVESLRRFGFNLFSDNAEAENPVYIYQASDATILALYSKRFDDDSNPAGEFAAVMVCSDADANCPYVPGAEMRISVTYDDPKIGDGTPKEAQIYDERSRQIASEMLFVMQEVSEGIGK